MISILLGGFAGIQLLEFGKQLLFGFFLAGIGSRSFDRANAGALRRIVKTDTFSTFVGVDFILGISLIDCIVGTLSGTSPTSDTVIRNLISHSFFPPNISTIILWAN